jgi:hypothetical protein
MCLFLSVQSATRSSKGSFSASSWQQCNQAGRNMPACSSWWQLDYMPSFTQRRRYAAAGKNVLLMVHTLQQQPQERQQMSSTRTAAVYLPGTWLFTWLRNPPLPPHSASQPMYMLPVHA